MSSGSARAALDPWTEVTSLLERAISRRSAAISLKDGGIIADGYNAELDELRAAANRRARSGCPTWRRREREQTGIKNLKIGYNRVFGYYIEVTKSFYDQVPYDATSASRRWPTAERFITQELKELEKTDPRRGGTARLRLEYRAVLRRFARLRASISARSCSARRTRSRRWTRCCRLARVRGG